MKGWMMQGLDDGGGGGRCGCVCVCGGGGLDVSRDEGMRAGRATGKDFGVGFGWSSGEKVDT